MRENPYVSLSKRLMKQIIVHPPVKYPKNNEDTEGCMGWYLACAVYLEMLQK